jgi:hypothetical protein
MIQSLMESLQLAGPSTLREILAFKKDWNNEVIAQFYTTVCFEEHGDTRKIHWMTESQ